ncbi:hypothetical protein ACFPRL_32175 [Pseudoclavibacter helvolus]
MAESEGTTSAEGSGKNSVNAVGIGIALGLPFGGSWDIRWGEARRVRCGGRGRGPRGSEALTH